MHSRGRKSGTSLIELLVATGIFGLLVITVFAIFDIGSRSYYSAETRGVLQGDVRRAEYFLSNELRESTFNYFNDVYYYPSGGLHSGNHALAFKTAVDYNRASPTRYRFVTDPASGAPVWQGWTIYYIIRPPGDTCPVSPDQDWDDVCPHKWLIKKVVTLNSVNTVRDLETFINTDLTTGQAGVLDVSKMADNVLSFNVYLDISKRPFRVDFDVKCFKAAQFSKNAVTTGGEDASGRLTSSDPNRQVTGEQQAQTYQVDNKVVPQN
ncbi:MAG: hypothetical protein M1536_07825 [Firmicutes bacterium]|nr:hypothetical protein [Bacillota bacterium]